MKQLLTTLLLLLGVPVFAATHCCGPSATGGGTGADWNNIMAFPSSWVRGDTYYLIGGNYGSRTFNTADSGTTGISIIRATVSAHGPATGWNNSFDSQATFAYPLQFSSDYWTLDGVTGSAFAMPTYGFVVARPSNCAMTQHYVNFELVHDITIRYMAISTCSSTSGATDPNNRERYCFYNDNAGWSHLYNVTLSHCYGENMQGLIYMVGASNVITEYCYTTNAFSSESSPDGSGHHGEVWDFITVGTPNRNCIVRYCNAQNGVGTGTLIANDSGGDNLSILGIDIYGNIFQNGSGGNGVIGCTTHSGMANAHVYNNTFYNNTTTWLVEAQAASSSTVKAYTTNNVATNNLVYNQNASLGNFGATPWFNDYNYYVHCTSVPTETHSATASANPFVNPPVDFHLNAQTPQGLALPSPYNTDPDGVSRSFPSRGAYEYVGNGPFITVQPQSVSILVGANATFSVVASGTPTLTYQWKLGGVNIAGATASSYTTNSVVIGANGNSYSVGVTNGFGGLVSSSAVLTVTSGGGGALTNIYVSPTGNIANTGASTNSPWPLDYAVAHVGDSNTIFLMDGNYTNTAMNITFRWTTMKALNKWGPRFANLPSDGTGGVFRGLLGTSVDGTIIDGLQFTNCQFYPILFRNPGTTNATVRNCWITQTGKTWPASSSASAMQFYPCLNALVEDNLLEWNGTNNIPFNHGIYVAGTNITIRGNVVRYNGGPGIQIYSGGTVPCDQIHCYNNLVYTNYTTFSAGSDIIYENDANNDAFVVNDFFNNTVVNQGQRYPIEIASSGTGRLTNNIILYNTGSGSGGIFTVSSPTIQRDYNLSTAALALTGAHDVVSSTENFVNRAQGLYWLASGAPARGTALGLSMVPWFGGNAATVTDIGSVQYAAGLTTDARTLDPSPVSGADYWTNITSGGVAPSITTQPVGTNIQVSQTFTLSVAVSGTPPFSYQWRQAGLNIANATASALTIPNAQPINSGNYVVVVTNVFGAVTSSVATVNVTNPAVAIIGVNPGQLIYGLQATNTQNFLSFQVQNLGSANLSYTVTSSPPFFVLLGGTNTALVPNGSSNVTIMYFPTNQSSLAPDTSLITVTNVTQGGQTNISAFGIAYTLQDPTNVSLTAATILYGFVSDTIGDIYQPFTSTSPLLTNNGVMYAGFTLPSSWTNAVLYGLAESTNIANNSFWVNIDQFPTDPQNIWDLTNINAGGLQQYAVTWRDQSIVNYTNQGGLTNVFNLAAGPHVIMVAGREANTVLSTMSLQQQSFAYPVPPLITLQPNSQAVLAGTPVTFTVGATGTLPLSYQWAWNGTNIAGANQTAYTIQSPLPSNNGLYNCTVTNAAGVAPSFAATLTVTNLPNPVGINVRVHMHGKH